MDVSTKPTTNPYIRKGLVPPDKAIVDQRRASRLFSPLILEGGQLGVCGERSMGKSSLLGYIANPPDEWRKMYFQNHIFVAFNCQDTVIPKTPANFWYEVIRHVDRKVKSGPIKEKCQTLLVKHKEGSELDHVDFHDILDAAGEEGKRIVLVLDDFHSLIWTFGEYLETTRIFLQGLRSLTTRDSNKANLVVATPRSLEELCKPLTDLHTSPFSNGFTGYRLQLFRKAEMDLLLQWIEEAGHPPFSPEEARYIRHLSGLHPRLAQITAAEIFDQRLEAGAPLKDLTPVGERFRCEARYTFEDLWEAADEVEQMLLMLIALQEQDGKVPECNYDLSDLPAIFSKEERELIELADRGLIRKQKDTSRWEIFSPIFDWWILKEIESKDPEYIDNLRKAWGNFLTRGQIKSISRAVDLVRENKEYILKFAQIAVQMAGWKVPTLG